MCAEAYQGEEPLRHINSAFMTFEVLDEEDRPRPLPRIRPEPLVRSTSRLAVCSDVLCALVISNNGIIRQILFDLSTGWRKEIPRIDCQKEDPTRQVLCISFKRG